MFDQKDFAKNGITDFQLKVLGVILMTFDSLRTFSGLHMPVWFSWMGRPVATLFLFASAEGYRHTRNKRKYLLRLLAGFWVMNLGNYVLSSRFPLTGSPTSLAAITANSLSARNVPLDATMFGTLFLGVLAMFLYDSIRAGIREKNALKIFCPAAVVLVSAALSLGMASVLSDHPALGAVLLNLIPVPAYVEGGLTYILLALMFYLCGDKKNLRLIVVAAVPALFFAASLSSGHLFTQNYGWMAVFSIVPIYLYNGERGKPVKRFFYAYYPLHIFAIYLAGYLIAR